jgi:hypothetical protein
VIVSFKGVYVQGPDHAEPTKVKSFKTDSEFQLCLERTRAEYAGRSGWSVVVMRETWDGYELSKLEELYRL